MSRLGSIAFARFGTSLLLCAAVFVLCWPMADATARDASQPAKRAATATKGKARVAASVDERRARAAKAPVAAASKGVSRARHASSRKGVAAKRSAVAVQARPAEAARTSLGHAIGLHAVDDPLSLKSAVALVVDQETGEVLVDKNSAAVLPIASISKLMTAIVVLDAQLPLYEMLAISEADVDTERNTRSRLGTGTRLSRGELLQLALMSSENRAAHALGRHYPGGMPAFVEQMNQKAREIGMVSTSFVEPTGLSSNNVSTARDLATLVRAASKYPLIREYSTSSGLTVDTGYRTVSYRNTNRLVGNPDWDIELQKTGYISEAGNCVVMQTRIDGRPVVIVLLDAQARMARVGDAQRIRQWLEHGPRTGVGAGAHKVSAHQRAAQPSRDS
ncbi:MAG TPA: D-alanyl-D-alanine endopeptidase [Aggregatilineaceae bacterium]|nr:D-alanyl-D-alanine endopeptidase [Aggregatilineaceae bacterium]